jgi:hypothetical protein
MKSTLLTLSLFFAAFAMQYGCKSNSTQPDGSGGAFSAGIQFQGAGDFIQVPLTSSISRIEGAFKPFTFEYRMKLDAEQNNTSVFERGSEFFSIVSGMQVVFAKGSGGGYACSANSNKLDTGVWYHIAYVYDGQTKLYVFVNGVQATYNLCANAVTPVTDPLFIGAADTRSSAKCMIDEFRVSDIARYTSNFSMPTSAFSSDGNTIMLFTFNEGSGNTVHDVSGNGNDGTLGGVIKPAWVH